MPAKRRLDKFRPLDEHQFAELVEGPGTCLLAGLGYCGPNSTAYWHLNANEQDSVRRRMRRDWQRIGHKILADNGRDVWALREFGEPQ
jgi:hypothetical protein